MTSPLLDSSALIALIERDHVHHDLVRAWKRRHPVALVCPISEGALVRDRLRLGWTIGEVQTVLQALTAQGALAFLPDDVSYAELDLAAVRGHKQVTDAYLVGLAARHGTWLATLDRRLVAMYADRVELIA